MSWTPSLDLYDWLARNDPEQSYGAIDADYQAAYLMNARAEAFGAVERQLNGTAQLAASTAGALRGLRGQDIWEGVAGDAYRAALDKLPPILDAAHRAYSDALSALAHFAETTAQLQHKYRAYLTELEGVRSRWETVASASYPDQAAGMAHIRPLMEEVGHLRTRRDQILAANSDALSTLQTRLDHAASFAPKLPPPSVLHRLLSTAEHILHTFVAVWDDGKAFVDHPTLKGFEQVTADVAADASLLVLAAGGGEAILAGGVLDGGAGLATTAAVAGRTGQALDALATAANVSAHEFDHEYGEGTLEALLALTPTVRDLATRTELRQTIGEAKLLASYKRRLDDGADPQTALATLSPEDQRALKAILPGYGERGAVDKAVAHVRSELSQVRKQAGLVEAPKGFIWENGVLVPVSEKVGHHIDAGSGEHHGD